jgi:hypothetical protein
MSMNSLYWLIAVLGAIVLVVLALAVADVLRTAGRGRVRATPPADRLEKGPTDTPDVLPPDTVQRLNGEAYTQPLYRAPERRRGAPRRTEPNGVEPAAD